MGEGGNGRGSGWRRRMPSTMVDEDEVDDEGEVILCDVSSPWFFVLSVY